MADDDFTPWTAAGAARLREAADALIDAIRTHANAVASLTSEADVGSLFLAGDELLPALREYADAQFDYTGTNYPLNALDDLVDEEDEDGDWDGDDDGPVVGVSILRRHDYLVADEESVLTSGRHAYRRVWPDDDAEAAEADVTDLGRALYQIAHADGWDALDDVAGLEPVGGVVIIRPADELLGDDPEGREEDLFAHDDDSILFRLDDVRIR